MERELLARARVGDTKAEQAMIDLYRPLCIGLARRYHSPGLDAEDLIQEATIGLLLAVRGFREEVGVKFITYAQTAVERHIIRAVATENGGIRLPVELGQTVHRLRQFQGEVLNKTGEEITLAEAATRKGLAPDRFQKMPERAFSLDQPIISSKEDTGTTLGDLTPSSLPTPEEALLANEDDPERVALVASLDRLPALEREVVARRIGLPPYPLAESLADVAEAMCYSREGVRKIEYRAVRRLRSFLGLGEGELGLSLGLNVKGIPTDRQRKIIQLWNSGLTQREITENLGVTQAHVSRTLRSWSSWLERTPQRGSKTGEWGHRKCAA